MLRLESKFRGTCCPWTLRVLAMLTVPQLSKSFAGRALAAA